jgi:hypothetical protein
VGNLYGLSFSRILQESATPDGTKYYSGGIKNLEELLRPENLTKLESLHVGIFCFLAFHPSIDNFVAEYIEKGSVASDSGRQILVLFIANTEFRSPKKIEKSDLNFGLELETSIHPAYEAVEVLFPTKKVDLPGLIFFDRFVDATNSIYVPLAGTQSVDNVATLCRTIFSLAQNSYNDANKKGKDFSNNFSVQLEMKRIRYERTQKISFREWLIKIGSKVYDHRGDIISVLSSLK